MVNKVILITLAMLFMALFLVLPLVVVGVEALSAGLSAYVNAITDPNVTSAVWMTLSIAAITVPCNLLFGVCASWCVGRFAFPGRNLLLTLIDLPFSISPVIAGLLEVLLFGLNGLLGGWLAAHNIQIIFALPGMVLATIFVTLPFVAREVIPLVQEQGNEEEEAAVTCLWLADFLACVFAKNPLGAALWCVTV